MIEITQQNPLGMRSLKESLADNMWENYKQNLSLDWVFDKIYEKVILVACFLWSVYSLIKFLWSIF